MLRSVRGPAEHCGWDSAAFLFIGRESDVPNIPPAWNDQFVRDPDGLFTEQLASEFETDVSLPGDAVDTGYSNPDLHLWIAPSDKSGVYVDIDGAFERWPRVSGDDPILCV
jgi:hypothetical protein